MSSFQPSTVKQQLQGLAVICYFRKSQNQIFAKDKTARVQIRITFEIL
jgi:hypothetical protein